MKLIEKKFQNNEGKLLAHLPLIYPEIDEITERDRLRLDCAMCITISGASQCQTRIPQRKINYNNKWQGVSPVLVEINYTHNKGADGQC